MSVQDMADIANHSRETSRKHYNKAPAAYCKLPPTVVHSDEPIVGGLGKLGDAPPPDEQDTDPSHVRASS